MDNVILTEKGGKEKGELKSPIKRIRNDIVVRASPMAVWQGECEETVGENNINQFATRVAPLEEIAIGYQLYYATPNCRWVSDFLSEEYWFSGDYIFLQSGPGSGKTTFAEVDLPSRFNKILYLTNRISNRMQFEQRNAHNYLMEVMSYQALETNTSIDGRYLDTFDIVVLDEFQYIISDSSFSNTTGITVRKVLESNSCVKLFISATLEYSFEYIFPLIRRKIGVMETLRKCKLYIMPRIIRNITTVSCVDWLFLIPVIKASEHKWICFVDSKRTGYWLEKELGEDALFIDSDRVKSDRVAKEVFQEIVEKERFCKKVLIATSLIDSGINVKDREVKCIALDVNSKVQIIQMMGRKRFIDDTDTIDLFFIEKNERQLKSERARLLKELEQYKVIESDFQRTRWPAQIINDNDEVGNMYRTVIYNDQQIHRFCFNQQGKFEIKKRIIEIEEMLNAKSSFKTKLWWVFGEQYTFIKIGMTMEAINLARKQEIIIMLQPYIGTVFRKLGQDAEKFRTKFTETYRRLFPLDLDDNYRSGRNYSFEKMNKIFIKLEIPVNIQIYYVKKVAYARIESAQVAA